MCRSLDRFQFELEYKKEQEIRESDRKITLRNAKNFIKEWIDSLGEDSFASSFFWISAIFIQDVDRAKFYEFSEYEVTEKFKEANINKIKLYSSLLEEIYPEPSRERVQVGVEVEKKSNFLGLKVKLGILLTAFSLILAMPASVWVNFLSDNSFYEDMTISEIVNSCVDIFLNGSDFLGFYFWIAIIFLLIQTAVHDKFIKLIIESKRRKYFEFTEEDHRISKLVSRIKELSFKYYEAQAKDSDRRRKEVLRELYSSNFVFTDNPLEEVKQIEELIIASKIYRAKVIEFESKL